MPCASVFCNVDSGIILSFLNLTHVAALQSVLKTGLPVSPNVLVRSVLEMTAKCLNVHFPEYLRANYFRTMCVRRSDLISETGAVNKVVPFGSLGLTNH